MWLNILTLAMDIKLAKILNSDVMFAPSANGQ